jgi:hypothetical protein
MNKLLILFITIVLTGCSEDWTTPREYNPDRRCIDGVMYYQGLRSLAPAFNRDSTVKTCKEVE